ncbi:MAG: Spy/CpxP family protein refolding chaperone [Pseudomonadota bacterium]|nr:Spy/CpxP family protein refolding chaperone [Pseudomonadota bacterium]
MAQAKSGRFNRTALQGAAGRWTMCAVVALSATLGVAAWAHDGRGDRPGPHAGMGGPGGFGPGLFAGSPERIERTVDRLLDGLKATDAQRAQIKQIATATAGDLKTQREAGRTLHERNVQIFTAPVVDANAAEQLRQQMLAQHDQMSRRMLQAMLDMSRVLSPEQRATLAQRMSHGGRPHADGGHSTSPTACTPSPSTP